MLKRDLQLEKDWKRISSEQDDHFATYRPVNSTYNEDEYFESGRRDLAAWLDRCGSRIGNHDHALDIGTGLGRLAFALRDHFAQVTANDITPHYLVAVEERAKRLGISGMHTVAYDGPWPTPDTYGMVLAINVLAIIESDEHLQSYFENIALSLHPKGIGILHLDTRGPNLKYRLRRYAPDRLLPPQWRKGFRRIRRNHEATRQMIARAGLKIVDEIDPRTEYTHFVVAKA